MFVSFRFINSRAHFLQLIFACGESQILAVRDYLAMVSVVVVISIVNNEKLQLFCGDFDWSKIRSYNHHQLITTETCRGPVHLVRDWLVHSTLPPTSRRPVREFHILFDVSLYKQGFWWHCDMRFLCVLGNTTPNVNRIPRSNEFCISWIQNLGKTQSLRVKDIECLDVGCAHQWKVEDRSGEVENSFLSLKAWKKIDVLGENAFYLNWNGTETQ